MPTPRGVGACGAQPRGERTEPDTAPGAELRPSAGTRLPQGRHSMRLGASLAPDNQATAPGPGNGAPDGMRPRVQTQDSPSGGARSQVLSLGSLTVTIPHLQPRLSTRHSVSGAPGWSLSASRAAGRAGHPELSPPRRAEPGVLRAQPPPCRAWRPEGPPTAPSSEGAACPGCPVRAEATLALIIVMTLCPPADPVNCGPTRSGKTVITPSWSFEVGGCSPFSRVGHN